jgi:hypothetical protein
MQGFSFFTKIKMSVDTIQGKKRFWNAILVCVLVRSTSGMAFQCVPSQKYPWL